MVDFVEIKQFFKSVNCNVVRYALKYQKFTFLRRLQSDMALVVTP